MSRARRLALVASVVAAAVLSLGAATAPAADECRGLQVCLPVEGPWVAIPAAGIPVSWDLRCPKKGYVVAGTDARLSDRRIDVGIRGETGSPVAPGTTTRESVLFTGLYVGAGRVPVAYRPFVGCIPTSGGGARGQTARAAVGEGYKPTQPVTRVVVGRKLPGGRTRVVVRCPGASRLVGWTHAVGFHTALPPASSVLGDVVATGGASGNTVTVVASVRLTALGSGPELQVNALCTRAVP